MSPRKCKLWSECHNDAVYQLPHANLALCKDHYLLNVQKRVKRLIEKKHMFHPHRDEKLLVAASGGKDSQVLLHLIKNIYPEGLDIEALYINLGISKKLYSDDSERFAREFCEQLSIPFHVISIPETFDFSIDLIHKIKEKLGYDQFHSHSSKNQLRGECAYCGNFKRYSINKFASENGFSAVATGHNLTDESTSLLNNFLNVKLQFLSRSGPVNNSQNDQMAPRVKPLFYISEEEIVMYAYFAAIPFNGTECPYSLQSPNIKLKQILKDIEQDRKGNMISMLHRYQKVMKPVIQGVEKGKNTKRKYNVCRICGQPTLSRECSFCKMIETLNSEQQRSGVNL